MATARVGIDDAAQVRPRLRLEKDVLPEVAEFALVLAGDEEGRRRALLAPLPAAHPPQIGQRQTHPLIDNSALAQLDLADAVRLSRIASVAQILDQKGAGARYGHQHLSRPLVRHVRGAHHQGRRWPPVGENMDCAQCHVGLACAALGHDPRRFGVAQVLCRPGNRQRLCRKRLAQQRCNARRHGVLCALQRRERIENPRSEFRGVCHQVRGDIDDALLAHAWNLFADQWDGIGDRAMVRFSLESDATSRTVGASATLSAHFLRGRRSHRISALPRSRRASHRLWP